MWVLGLIFAVLIILFIIVSTQLALGMLAMLFGFFPNGEGGWTWDPGAWLGYVAILGAFTTFVLYA